MTGEDLDDDYYSEVSEQLFDLSIDPYELNDLVLDQTYQQQLELFRSRRSYWLERTAPINEPVTKTKGAGFGSCGRVCCWLDNLSVKDSTQEFDLSKYEPVDIPDVFSPDSVDPPPHIVFVLIDDWGYNDFGARSTYLDWTTPTIDSLASQGILLTNYYTNQLCGPSRASLMTGRFATRLGVVTNHAELPLSETTLAQELKSAGYRTYAVGKWHLGYSQYSYLPLQRGFDSFYGFMNGDVSYWSKYVLRKYIDLWEDNSFVTDKSELSSTYHAGYLYQEKAEDAIKFHAKTYKKTPMFLYYSMQLIHYPWTAPEIYLSRCTDDRDNYLENDDEYSSTSILYNYCAMNVMMDEAIANLTCTLSEHGFSDNTVLIISGDNGGEGTVSGNSYPFRGHKGSFTRGGLSNTAIIHSKLIPKSRRGSSYDGAVHITDWYPTVMNLATKGEWKGSFSGAELDGRNIWDAALNDEDTEELINREIVFSSASNETFVMQLNNLKYMSNYRVSDIVGLESQRISDDLNPTATFDLCIQPSLVSTYRHFPWHRSHISSVLDTTLYFFAVSALLLIVYRIYSNAAQDDEKERVIINHEKAYLLPDR